MRVAIRKREVSEVGSLLEDYRQLACLFCEVEWRVYQRLFPGARTRLDEFRHLLEEHLAIEERAAPPQAKSTEDAARIQYDLQKHHALRRIAQKAGDAIDAHDPQAFSSLASDLVEVLALHANAAASNAPQNIKPH